MAGVNANTGRPLYGDDRIVQSIRRLVVTDGDLVMRRHLINALPDAVGAPNNSVTALAYCALIAGQIEEGEQRCDLKTIRFLEGHEVPTEGGGGLAAENSADGQAWLFIGAISKETGKQIELTELVQ
jgi:phage baseplate assembly protein W